jgi:hypothetical protein
MLVFAVETGSWHLGWPTQDTTGKLELRDADDDGGEMLATAIFSFRTCVGLTDRYRSWSLPSSWSRRPLMTVRSSSVSLPHLFLTLPFICFQSPSTRFQSMCTSLHSNRLRARSRWALTEINIGAAATHQHPVHMSKINYYLQSGVKS